jgi:hypothetical protein
MAEIAGENLNDILNLNVTLPQNARERAILVLQRSSVISNLIPGGVYTPDNTALDSVEKIIAPISIKGDTFTAYQQTPLNDTGSDFNLTGTGSRSNPPPRVFEPENVVLLTDGTCGSTCTLFSYYMIMQRNIKTTVVGGRPQTGRMQSIAGVEGAQVFPLEQLSAAASAVLTLRPSANVTGTELALISEGYLLSRTGSPTSFGAVNGKNAFSAMDAQTPLQFMYQAANCRFFYTKDMIYSPAEVWKRTVDATWTNPEQFCVEGSRVAALDSPVEIDSLFFGAQQGGSSDATRASGGWNLSLLFAVLAMAALYM